MPTNTADKLIQSLIELNAQQDLLSLQAKIALAQVQFYILDLHLQAIQTAVDEVREEFFSGKS